VLHDVTGTLVIPEIRRALPARAQAVSDLAGLAQPLAVGVTW